MFDKYDLTFNEFQLKRIERFRFQFLERENVLQKTENEAFVALDSVKLFIRIHFPQYIDEMAFDHNITI